MNTNNSNNSNHLTWAITFQWNDGNKPIIQQISQSQVTKHNGFIIIGRDENVCDLVLNNQSVSSQQAQIYFNESKQQFFIKNIKAGNTTIVDGNNVDFNKEMLLNNGSIIILGQQQIEINEIKIYPLPSTNYSGVVSSNVKPVTVNPNPILPSLNTNNENSTIKPKFWQNLTLIIPIIVASITASGVIIGHLVNYYVGKDNTNVEKEKIDVEKEKKELEKYKANLQKEIELTKLKVDKLKEAQKRYYEHQDRILDFFKTKKHDEFRFNRLTLINNCAFDINIAASFTALDGRQETRGWMIIESNLEKPTHFYTRDNQMFLYAYAAKNKDGEYIKWKRTKFSISKDIIDTQFSYINDDFFTKEDEIFLAETDQKIENKKYTVDFNKVDLEEGKRTIKTFTCDENELKLQ